MAVALIVAAGSGERLGASRPKAFVTLAGRTMLEWSLEAMRAATDVQEVVVALPPGEAAPEGTVGVPGGPVRSASVRAALGTAGPHDRVVVHDAARPLVTPELVTRTLGALDDADAAIAAAPVPDTIKEATLEGLVSATLRRDRLWAVQTPQAFRRAALERALSVDEATLAAATDDAWLVERSGGRVRVVESTEDNLKVTTPADLRLAEILLAERC